MTDSPPPILKPKNVFRDTSPDYTARRRRGYVRMTTDCLRFVFGRGPASLPPRPKPFSAHPVDPRFFGMNVCPSPDPEGDAEILKALSDLGVAAVRIDYGQRADRGPADRLIAGLLDYGYPITLHLVQDPADAATMHEQGEATEEWRAFVREALDCYGHHIEAIEIGSTPNRHSWSGYTIADYATATRIARDVLDAWTTENGGEDYAPLFLGPNISDFAPYFTIGQLAECYRRGVRFDAMTDNLFIDRVGEPEAYDQHVLGEHLKGLARMDLARKQQALLAIGRRFGARSAWCTYTHYTLNFGRERRRYVSEEQYADYMVRQHLVTAAAGSFDRLYWGTLVSHHKGLTDESLGVRPYPPFVHHRFATDAPPAEWKRRDLFFRAYATMTSWLANARFTRRIEPAPGVTVLEFENDEKRIDVGWTRDGMRHDLDLASIGAAHAPRRVASRDGHETDSDKSLTLSPSPTYWRYT